MEGSGRPISSPGKKLTSQFFPREKKITSQFFPHPVSFFPTSNFSTSVYLVLGLGKNCAGQLFLHTDRSKHLTLVLGWGKIGPAHFFPTLTRFKINLVQKVIGWEKTVVHMVNCNCLGKTQPTSPCHKYTYNLCFFGGAEKLGRPILSPP